VTTRSWTLDALLGAVRGGDRRAVARAISLVENGDPLGRELVSALYPDTGHAYAIGVTGPPGVGKSSLIAALVVHARGLDLTVGVLSVDPSSPFTRGALLGDRIRLAGHFLDPHVFIRSMATRGHAGGLAEATLQSALILDAAGKDVLLLETVGAGQSEVEVASVADTVLLVLMPGSGDAVQALKAGIMEIPDVIAVNKRDLSGTDDLVRDLRQVIALGDADRRPDVVRTDALGGVGVADLWEALAAHRRRLEETGALAERRSRNLAGEVLSLAEARARELLERAARDDPELRGLLERVAARQVDPLTAVEELMRKVFSRDGDGDGGGTGVR
jgi:LAO/AO transport system kinase